MQEHFKRQLVGLYRKKNPYRPLNDFVSWSDGKELDEEAADLLHKLINERAGRFAFPESQDGQQDLSQNHAIVADKLEPMLADAEEHLEERGLRKTVLLLYNICHPNHGSAMRNWESMCACAPVWVCARERACVCVCVCV